MLLGDALLKLLGDLEVNLDRSPWAREQGVDGWAANTADELVEFMEAHTVFRGLGGVHVQAELGDVLWCALTLLLEVERQLPGAAVDALTRAREKLRRRKPWIFDPSLPQPSSAAEEHEWTQANKLKEQEERSK